MRASCLRERLSWMNPTTPAGIWNQGQDRDWEGQVLPPLFFHSQPVWALGGWTGCPNPRPSCVGQNRCSQDGGNMQFQERTFFP